MANAPKYMGFNTTQINTLRRLLEEAGLDVQDQLDALEARVADLEDAP